MLVSSLFLAGCTLPVQTSSGTPAPTPTANTDQKESLGSILASGGAAECKIRNLANNNEIDYLVSGNKYKVMGTDLGEGKKGGMIVDGSYTYTWQEGQKSGFKIQLSEEEAAKTSAEDATRSATAYTDESKFKMECKRKQINDNDFTPPAEIKFVNPYQVAPGSIQNMLTK